MPQTPASRMRRATLHEIDRLELLAQQVIDPIAQHAVAVMLEENWAYLAELDRQDHEAREAAHLYFIKPQTTEPSP